MSSSSTLLPDLSRIEILVDENPLRAYRELKRVTFSDLQCSSNDYRLEYVRVCLDAYGATLDSNDRDVGVVVGCLLVAGMGLAAHPLCCDSVDDVESINRFCGCVVGPGTPGILCSQERYGVALVKSMNKVALGLLSKKTYGDEDMCLKVVRCMCTVAEVYSGEYGGGEVWVRVCRGVTAMAAHGTLLEEWMDVVSGLISAGGARDIDLLEEGISCVRRMMMRVEKEGVGLGAVPRRLLEQVALLYRTSAKDNHTTRDAHAGLAAIGAVVKSLDSDSGAWDAAGFEELFAEAMEGLLGLDGSQNRVDTRELAWLSGVLYTKGRSSSHLRWLMAWSMRCSLAGMALCHTPERGNGAVDSTILSRCCSDAIQCAMVLTDDIIEYHIGRDDIYSILVDSLICLRQWGQPGDASLLVARVIKRAYLSDRPMNTLLASELLSRSTKKIKDISVWADLAKDSMCSLACVVRERRRQDQMATGSESACADIHTCDSHDEKIYRDAEELMATVHNVFNPGKNPDAYLEVATACHAHIDAFPTLVSTDRLFQTIDRILENTKTKIGKQRIADAKSVMELLKLEDSLRVLVNESKRHAEVVSERLKRELRMQPSLVHSEEWKVGDSLHQAVKFMLENHGRWQVGLVSAIDGTKLAREGQIKSKMLSSQLVLRELDAFIGMHDTNSPYWKYLVQISNSGPCAPGNNNDGGDAWLEDDGISKSKAYASSGNILEALRIAVDCHKKTELCRRDTGLHWWSSMASHEASCSWLGFLFSVCGMYEESRRAYSDGLRGACQVGAVPLALFFSLALADLHLVGGDRARFQAHTVDIMNLMSYLRDEADEISRLLSMHGQVLLASIDRQKLNFASAASKLSMVQPETGSWYESRVMALACWQEILLELEQDSAMTYEEIEGRLSARGFLEPKNYHTALLGAPFSIISVVRAQLLSMCFFDDHRGDGNDSVLWKVAKSGVDGLVKLASEMWCLLGSTRATSFCQGPIMKLLAPVCASLGCKYASILLLHAASNPTLEFQHDLVQRMKGNGSHANRIFEEFFGCSNEKFEPGVVESNAKLLVQQWTAEVPELVLCGISVYDSSTFGPCRPRRDSIVIHRLKHGHAPLVVEIPAPEMQSTHPIQELQGTKSCGAIQYLGERLDDIINQSNKNMRGVSEASTEAEQRAWWQERVQLDHSMQQILHELQTDWIGPWRCLFSTLSESDGGDEWADDEMGLLRILLRDASLSAMELKSISRVLDIDLAGLADEFEGTLQISQTVDKATEKRGVNRKVSFHAADISTELCSKVRSAEGMPDADGVETAPIAQTPSGKYSSCSPNKTLRAGRKHKSRLAHLQPLATPNPRRVLGAQNFSGNSFQTPNPPKHRGKFHALDQENVCHTRVANTMPVLRRKGNEMDDASQEACKIVSVALVLDHALQRLPWESSFHEIRDRVTSGSIEFYRIPSIPTTLSRSRQRRSRESRIQSTYYAINPSGDLVATQNTFESWFKNLQGWSGCAGSPPSADELSSALQTSDLFVYCGHGGGEQYLPVPRLRALDTCASSLLMGCSSGKLLWNPEGSFDASGVALAYVLAGCPAVVGNLWDVTDKDIDRYCVELLTSLLGKKGNNIGSIVQESRGSCKLRHLVGASPIVFGLPVNFV
jgi:hypothetical protein